MDRGAPALRVERTSDVAAFDDRAGAFLREREAENCLILGLCASLRRGRSYGSLPPSFVIVTAGGAVVGAAMRTPPLNLIIAAGSDPRSVPAIVDDLGPGMAQLPGTVGPVALARSLAELWGSRSGVRPNLSRSERIYRLDQVRVPRVEPAAGSMRLATPGDRELVVEWLSAFAQEALDEIDPAAARSNAEWWIESRGLHLWLDGEPVSMAGATGPTPNGIRIGAVYTPPDKRRRGYASALVAALSQAQLDAGRRFCFLFTDLANPTSNKIYQDIGYEPVCDVDEYRFAAPAPADT
ncbi:MAG: GNAT family N-acetyltransferase [Candidatus Limnocylindria bacterium]